MGRVFHWSLVIVRLTSQSAANLWKWKPNRRFQITLYFLVRARAPLDPAVIRLIFIYPPRLNFRWNSKASRSEHSAANTKWGKFFILFQRSERVCQSADGLGKIATRTRSLPQLSGNPGRASTRLDVKLSFFILSALNIPFFQRDGQKWSAPKLLKRKKKGKIVTILVKSPGALLKR